MLVTVGTDHHRFDRLIGWVDRWAADHPEVAVLVQHGTATAPAHGEAVVMLGYDELVSAMAEADVVIAQGGPATIMDARSVGHRPIVVPRRGHLDEVVDDHQVAFTDWMAAKELVWLATDEAELEGLLLPGDFQLLDGLCAFVLVASAMASRLSYEASQPG